MAKTVGRDRRLPLISYTETHATLRTEGRIGRQGSRDEQHQYPENERKRGESAVAGVGEHSGKLRRAGANTAL
jgi:hypothetical protein